METGKIKLKHLLMSIALLGVGALIFSSTAYADGTLLSEVSGTGNHWSRGYNSATMKSSTGMSYADHDTTRWQDLSSPNPGGYGVSWSINGGSFGHDDMYVGQNVTFKFNMNTRDNGNHYANLMKGWIDWDTTVGNNQQGGNVGGTYNLDDSAIVVNDSIKLRNSPGGSLIDYNGSASGLANDLELEYSLTLLDEHEGTAFLRARATCTHSLREEHFNTSNSQWSYTLAQYESAFDSWSDYSQGEIEDWTFNVAGIQGAPEPATMVLFGMGLIGLARIGRKKA